MVKIVTLGGRILTLLLDTGAEVSLIKNSGLDGVWIDDNKVKIFGIVGENLESEGIVELDFEFYPSLGIAPKFCHKFHVFQDIDIQFDGILGNDFLKDNKFNIDYCGEKLFNDNIKSCLYFDTPCRAYLPARSECIVRVPIVGSLNVGYIEKQCVAPGCYISDCITKRDLDSAIVTMINATDEFMRFEVFPFELKPIPEVKFKINAFDNLNKIDIKRWEKVKENLRVDHLNLEERDSLYKICKNYVDLFHLEGDFLDHTTLVEHHIPLEKDASPVCAKTYRYPKVHESEVNAQINKMLEQEIIRPSHSPWSSPLWVVPKKLDSSGKMKWRVVIDYRKLNEKTIGDNYPLPSIADILDQLGNSKYFTSLDLASGFHQIPLKKEDIPKTAFSTPLGHYEFTRMPFGLKNAPSCFQRLMNTVLTGIQGIKCFVYLDDIIIYASSLKDHEDKLVTVFNQLKSANLKLQPDKCEFLRQEICYLGHVISENGVKPNPEKLKVLKEYVPPKSPKQIKQFLGLVGYYRRFIPNFSKISQNLTKLLRKDVKFEWGTNQQNAFEELIKCLMMEPILQYPDFNKEFNLTVDASNYALGAILSQKHGDKLLPIAYASRTLNRAEGNYSTTEKECLAIVWAVKHFRPYLYGRKFIIYSDHKPLHWLFNVKDPGSRLVRWRLKLEEYDYEIQYKKGSTNNQADCLSRLQTNPIETEEIRDILRESCSGNNAARDNENLLNNEGRSTELKIPENLCSDGIIVNFTDSYFESPTYSNRKMSSKEKELLSKENVKVGNIIKFAVAKQKTIHMIFKENEWEDTNKENAFEMIDDLYEMASRYKILYITRIFDTNVKQIMDCLEQKFSNNNEIKLIMVEENEIIIPKPDEINKILKEMHTSMVGGHAGFIRMLKNIKVKYKWKNMNKDIEKYVKSCVRCQQNKINRRPVKNPMLITTTSKKTFERIALDIFGPLAETKNGNKYVLSIQDDLSKYTFFIPLKDQEATTIASALFHEFISKFGVPSSILTDQGQNFMGVVLQNLCKLFKIKKLNTTPYHPQTNGALERVHATLTEYLRNFIKNKDDWDELLNFASFSYNTNIHSSTNFTPYELVFGYKPELPFSLTSNDLIYDDYINKLKTKILKTQQIARENIIKNKEKSKQYYDKSLNKKQYRSGDKIFIRVPTRNKLNPLYDGPYTVLSSTENTVRIKRNNKIISYNINNTKPYVSD